MNGDLKKALDSLKAIEEQKQELERMFEGAKAQLEGKDLELEKLKEVDSEKHDLERKLNGMQVEVKLLSEMFDDELTVRKQLEADYAAMSGTDRESEALRSQIEDLQAELKLKCELIQSKTNLIQEHEASLGALRKELGELKVDINRKANANASWVSDLLLNDAFWRQWVFLFLNMTFIFVYFFSLLAGASAICSRI